MMEKLCFNNGPWFEMLSDRRNNIIVCRMYLFVEITLPSVKLSATGRFLDITHMCYENNEYSYCISIVNIMQVYF